MEKITLRLVEISWRGPQLFFSYEIDGLRYSNAIWYQDVDLEALERSFGSDNVRNIYFHIAAFELNKLCSLKPDSIDWGDYYCYATPRFLALWGKVFQKVWGQWRYENRLPDYEITTARPPANIEFAASAPITRNQKDHRYLLFFGGGKDSLVSAKILDDLGKNFDTLSYAASFYGTMAHQHEMIGRVLRFTGSGRNFRQWVFDDFLDSPILELTGRRGVETLAAAETPSSIFGSLPYVLSGGYTHIILAHERSADKGQLVWAETGEEVNHQWGKSYEAQILINAYIRDMLISDLTYASILKPVFDIAIFHALRNCSDSALYTHSCNIEKPWCLRCAKCLYVWLGYAAFLDRETVLRTFGGGNLLDVPENIDTYRQLVGLEDRLPFECIGHAQEAALFMLLARARGFHGCVYDSCKAAIDDLDVGDALQVYLDVDQSCLDLPREFQADVLKWMRDNSNNARKHITETLPMNANHKLSMRTTAQ